MDKRLIMLMILDGFGINEKEEGNAVKLANIPHLNDILTKNPNTIIHTSGADVGLPDGQMGNSEVGHTNIGAGRIVYQDLAKITKEIEEGNFFSVPEFVKAIENCKANNSKLHILGLLSDGGVHSHNRHLYALLELAKRKDFENVYIHCFMDGRDTPPASGEGYISELQEKIKEKGVGQIATISGRFYSMDRDKRWERVSKAYNAMVNGDPIAKIEDGDSVIFFNFRPDRAREITRSIVDKDYDGFETKKINTYFVCMTPYDETMPNVEIAYKKEEIKNTFGEYISRKGLKQLRIAETEKYAHVTFFFNGGEEKQYEGEDRILVPSPKVETYDLKPEMSAYEVCDKVVDAIKSEKYDSIILNFANPDMVGHTGVIDAAVKALEAIDECVQKVVEAINSVNGVLLITADHGNCEQMIDYETGEPHTAHTTNPVPLAIVGLPSNRKIKEGRLADLAPTMLDIMGLEKPDEMTGVSLLEN